MKAATCFSGIGAPETACPHWDWVWVAETTGGPAGDECYNLVAFDLQQATSPENRSQLSPDQTPTMGAAHQMAVAYKSTGNNGVYSTGDKIDTLSNCKDPNHDIIAFTAKDYGADATEGHSPTLRSMAEIDGNANGGGQIAVAFQTRVARNGRGDMSDVVPALNGADAGETSDMRPCVAVFKPSHYTRGKDGEPSDVMSPLSVEADRGDQESVLFQTGKVKNAYAVETDTVEALRSLRVEVGEKEISEWAAGIIAAFWPQEVLRSKVHGLCFRCPTEPERGLVNYALSRAKSLRSGAMPSLWSAGCDGRSPQGWQSHEQRSDQLGSYLSKLPHQTSPAERFMQTLWESSEGDGLLRETLSAIEAARRSAVGESQPVSSSTAVRRLVPEECEALQAYPRGYTLIAFRGKPAADGPRYKALGNSMCVNEIRWVLQRIEQFEECRK